MSLGRILKDFAGRVFVPGMLLRTKYEAFKELLDLDRAAHHEMALLESYYHNGVTVDFHAVERTCRNLIRALSGMVHNLSLMAPRAYTDLPGSFLTVSAQIERLLITPHPPPATSFLLGFQDIGSGSEGCVGGKAAHLAVLHNDLHLPVPRGFVIPAAAFYHFCEFNRLTPHIEAALSDLDIHSPSSLEQTSNDLVSRFLNAAVPPAVEEALMKGYDGLSAGGDSSLPVCLRSSAVGEDSALSFAGQYRTELQVRRDRLGEAYKSVISSKYTAKALYYRVENGLLDQETPMAVLVLEMVDTEAAGILYTRDPLDPVSRTLKIYSVWGLGELLVKGEVAPDLLEISSEENFRIIRARHGAREHKAVLRAGREIEMVPLVERERRELSLDEAGARQLAQWGVQLEAHFGVPQDVEWCKGRNGDLYLLQSRPLRMEKASSAGNCEEGASSISLPVLLAAGEKASSGIGTGAVVKMTSLSNLRDVPEGAVLVAPTTSPRFTQIIGRLRAVVTDVGSVAGHFASVAREWGIPLLVNTQTATGVLREGDVVTVDAGAARVYAGSVAEGAHPTCEIGAARRETPFKKRLREVLKRVSPLNLTDSKARNFSPESCETLHDFLRFIHEKAVEEMFSTGTGTHGKVRGARQLATDIPIAVYVLDLGEGLRPEEGRFRKGVTLEDILNRPFKALWKGLSHPGIRWDSGLRHLDWQEFDRVSGGIFSMKSPFLSSFALIGRHYLNVNIRFGYHFVVLDAFCGPNVRENYITLHFEGGGGDYVGRTLRVLFLARVLHYYGFETHPEGDMITAHLKKASPAVSEGLLELAGQLLGFTRLVDLRLKDKSDVDELMDEFLQLKIQVSEDHADH